MIVRAGRGLPPALQGVVDRLAGELASLGGLGGTVAVGVDDSWLPGPDARRPLLVVPACGPGPPTPWGEALVRSADAVALLDAIEVRDLRAALEGRPVLLAGLPAPTPREEGLGLDPGGGPARLRAAWERHRPAETAGAGVAWVSGRGLAPLAAALDAWAAGRAVVALPGVPRHDLLRRGLALHAGSQLEALEATRYLLGAPALARSLGSRGREVASALPSARTVAARLLEGGELARQSAGPSR